MEDERMNRWMVAEEGAGDRVGVVGVSRYITEIYVII